MFVSAFTAFGSFPARAGSLPTDSSHGNRFLSFYKGLTALMDDKAKENEEIREFFFLRKKSLSLASERHIVNRISPNLASFYQEGAHQG